MRLAALSLIWAVPLLSQTPAPPIEIKYECSADDIDAFGMTCSDDEPCPVFLELSSAASNGSRLFIAGNLHTRDTTLFGLLLASDDNGVTWSEPAPRISGASFEQVEFSGAQHGWVSGESVDPLTRNPFLLLSADGGKTWREQLMFEDARFGAVSQFHFNSPSSGELVLDTSQGKTIHQELYASETGGESWEMRQKSSARLHLNNLNASQSTNLRLRADAATGAVRLERNGTDNGNGKTWESLASFTIHVSDCR